jgi:tRNA-2-methylthio-N6-dimethylallyladenosine synthase
MNVRDSEVICGLLEKEGYKFTEDTDKADVILFNTCSVRQHAEDRVWSQIGKYKNKKSIIGIVGCMAQNYKSEIFKRAPQVDFVVGPNDIHRIPEIIKKLTEDQKSKICQVNGGIRPEEIYHTDFRENNNHAYVVISQGCSNNCSYCIVPYVRGELVCRDYNGILREIKEAIDKGISKITLLGQNVNSYQYDNVDFIRLLELIDRIKGLEEFSFITSHPKDTKLELFRVMSDSKKLRKFLHLPVQSGSDRILELMNRGYNRRFYLDLVQNYRKIVRGGLLTTDIITGFPTETESDFCDTYDLMKKIQFDSAYIFKYSSRPHTQASRLSDDVPKEEKERRHRILLDLQIGISNKIK